MRRCSSFRTTRRPLVCSTQRARAHRASCAAASPAAGEGEGEEGEGESRGARVKAPLPTASGRLQETGRLLLPPVRLCSTRNILCRLLFPGTR